MMKEDERAIEYANKAINILNTSKMSEVTKQKHMKNLQFMMAYLQKIREDDNSVGSPEGDDKKVHLINIAVKDKDKKERLPSLNISGADLKDVLKTEDSISLSQGSSGEPDTEPAFPKISSTGKPIIKHSLSKPKISEPILDIENYPYELSD